MTLLCIGVFFILFNFTIPIGEVFVIGLIPAFVGWILILRGINQIEEESKLEAFKYLKNCCMIMIIYTLISYMMDLFGLSAALNVYTGGITSVITMLIGLAATFFQAHIIFGIIDDMLKSVEQKMGLDLMTDKLHSVYNISFITTLVVYVIMYIPYVNILSIPGAILVIVVDIMFLYNLCKSKNEYYSR